MDLEMPKTGKQNGVEKRPRDREATRALLIRAVGKMLAEQGFIGLGVNAVAQEAGVDKVLIYRYFGGMPGLITAFGQEGDFWPSIEELAGGDIESFRQLALEDKLYALGRNFLAGIRKRPLTQEIMAWEMVERNDLTVELETIRETRMLRFAEMFLPDAGAGIDLMAISAIIGAGITYLVCRSRKIRWYNGIDLGGDEGWRRIERGIEQVVKGSMKLL
jgi:AcrR family transcriptional regulator